MEQKYFINKETGSNFRSFLSAYWGVQFLWMTVVMTELIWINKPLEWKKKVLKNNTLQTKKTNLFWMDPNNTHFCETQTMFSVSTNSEKKEFK